MANRPEGGGGGGPTGATPAREGGNQPADQNQNRAPQPERHQGPQSSLPPELRNDPQAIAVLRERFLEEQQLEIERIRGQRRTLNQTAEQQARNEAARSPEQVRATADQAAREMANHAHHNAGDVARAMAPNASPAEHDHLTREVAQATSKPSFFKRVGTFIKEKVFSGAAAGFVAAVGTKALIRIAAINMINPAWWVYMGAGAVGGAGVEGVREIWKQSKKLEDLDHVLDELRNTRDLTQRALIINRLEKLQAEARINRDEPSFHSLSGQLQAARMSIQLELDRERGNIPRDQLKQLNYILHMRQRSSQETPKTMRKNIDKLLKDLENSWNYERTLRGLDKGRIGRAMGRGALIGATAGAFGWLLAEKVHLGEKIYSAFKGGGVGAGGAAREAVQQHIESSAGHGSNSIIHLSKGDTVWNEAHQWLKLHHVPAGNINNHVLNDAIKNLSDSNHFEIVGHHGFGGHHHIANALRDIRMPVGHEIDMSSLNQMIHDLGGQVPGGELAGAAVSAAAETPATQAAHEGATALWGYLSADALAGNLVAGVAEEGANRYFKGKEVKNALHGNARDAQAEMPAEYERQLRAQERQLEQALQQETRRDVRLRFTQDFSPERLMLDGATQEQVRTVLNILREPRIAERLGGCDIYLAETGGLPRVFAPPGQPRRTFIIPIDADPNLIRATLENGLRASTPDQLRERFGNTFAVQVEPALQLRINQGLALPEMAQVNDILVAMDPALLRRIGTIRLGYPLAVTFPAQGQGELSFNPGAEPTPATLSAIEDVAEASGIQFERVTPRRGIEQLRQAAGQLETRMNELMADGNNAALMLEADRLITAMGGHVAPDHIHAHAGLTEIVADRNNSALYVPPAIRRILLLREAVQQDRQFADQMSQPGRVITMADRVSIQTRIDRDNQLLAQDINDGVEADPTAAELQQAKTNYDTRKLEMAVNHHITIDDSRLTQDLTTNWPPRQRAVYYEKWTKFFDALDNDPQAAGVRTFLQGKTLEVSNDPNEGQRFIANGNIIKIRPDLSVPQIVEAMQRAENPTAISPAEQRSLNRYTRRKTELQAQGVTLDDAVLLGEIQSLAGDRERQNLYKGVANLYERIAADNGVKQALAGKTLHMDKVPRGNRLIRVRGNDVHVSIESRTPRAAFEALKAELVPAANPNAPPNPNAAPNVNNPPGPNNPNAPRNPNVRTGEPTTAEFNTAKDSYNAGFKGYLREWGIQFNDAALHQVSQAWSNRQEVDFYAKMNTFWRSLRSEQKANLSGEKLTLDWSLGAVAAKVEQPAAGNAGPGNPREVKINPGASIADIKAALVAKMNGTELDVDPVFKDVGDKEEDYNRNKSQVFSPQSGVTFRDGAIRGEMSRAGWTPQQRSAYFDTLSHVIEEISQQEPTVWSDMRGKTIVISDTAPAAPVNPRYQVWIKWNRATPPTSARIKNEIIQSAAIH